MAERLRARLMQDTNLYPAGMPPPTDPKFRSIPGIPVGTVLRDRKECSKVGLHGPPVAGIWGTPELGAFSIVASGGYEDDRDEGEVLIYTGTGGQIDSYKGNNVQTKDQTFNHQDNMALKKSVETRRPVRVIRGHTYNSKYAPREGYRYDGDYIVVRAYLAPGKSGFKVCKYELRRVPKPGQLPIPTKI
ncbi:E3 ubiquitin-protein ligase UHRF1 [Hypsizygus marmoreus]|uniref:E3 ubiquitin-protein ligase UHRF1 n=1 Tax=Hypsizygus marmoreus TaxID=39966 RepID=A0A369JQI0_HYPMA|nr:E3 ubiquitin-protein ligase UHRF1 [Hypsizygus marmoreus]